MRPQQKPGNEQQPEQLLGGQQQPGARSYVPVFPKPFEWATKAAGDLFPALAATHATAAAAGGGPLPGAADVAGLIRQNMGEEKAFAGSSVAAGRGSGFCSACQGPWGSASGSNGCILPSVCYEVFNYLKDGVLPVLRADEIRRDVGRTFPLSSA